MDDLIERLRSEYHLSQGDGYDALIKTGAEAADRITSLQQALEAIFKKLDKGPGRSAPGHGHTIPGVWDDDSSNGERAGTPCAWCAQWEQARAALRGEG